MSPHFFPLPFFLCIPISLFFYTLSPDLLFSDETLDRTGVHPESYGYLFAFAKNNFVAKWNVSKICQIATYNTVVRVWTHLSEGRTLGSRVNVFQSDLHQKDLKIPETCHNLISYISSRVMSG